MPVKVLYGLYEGVGGLDISHHEIANDQIVSGLQHFIRYFEVEPKLFVRQNDVIGLIDN